jgi:uncharacterized protein (TIGR03086 family)
MNTELVDLNPPAQQLKAVLNGVTDDQLAGPTPCPEYTVRNLVGHLLGLATAFTDAASKADSPMQRFDPNAGGLPEPTEDWRDAIPAQLDDLVAAWHEPEAWQGMTMAGGAQLPGAIAGKVAINELIVHGWDLAKSTGQPYTCDPASAQAALEFLSMAAQAPPEQRGPFGPVVDVPSGAQLLDQLIGLSGRDPNWAPTGS